MASRGRNAQAPLPVNLYIQFRFNTPASLGRVGYTRLGGRSNGLLLVYWGPFFASLTWGRSARPSNYVEELIGGVVGVCKRGEAVAVRRLQEHNQSDCRKGLAGDCTFAAAEQGKRTAYWEVLRHMGVEV